MDFCFHLVQNPPPGFFQTGSGAFSAAPSARTFDAMTHPKTALEHCVQVKRSLISIFWKSRVYLDHSISTVKIGRIELAESSLQIRAQVSSRKIDLVTGVTLDSCRFCESWYFHFATHVACVRPHCDFSLLGRICCIFVLFAYGSNVEKKVVFNGQISVLRSVLAIFKYWESALQSLVVQVVSSLCKQWDLLQACIKFYQGPALMLI